MDRSTQIVAAALLCLTLIACYSGNNPSKIDKAKLASGDSISKSILQIFALPYAESMQFDSSSLLFYRSSSYDTSFLIQINHQGKLVRGVYYEMLPQFHRFRTDYADERSNLLYFVGSSFIIDSVTWSQITQLGKALLKEDINKYSKLKYTDGSTYGLYYLGSSIHGDSNSEEPFERFYTFLRQAFLDNNAKLRKPIMEMKTPR